MNEPPEHSLLDLLDERIRTIARQEIEKDKAGPAVPAENDSYITPEEAAIILGGDPKKQVTWLYRHSKELTFTHRLSRRKLRINEAGLRHWLKTRK